MVLHSVLRPNLSNDGKVSLQAFGLDTHRWNSAYTFLEAAKQIAPIDRRLVDPLFLIIQLPLHTAVRDFRYFTVNDLMNVACYHGVPYKGLRKDTLISRLSSHTCNISCSSTLYIFKVLNKLRAINPWNETQSSHQWRSPAIGNTATRSSHSRTSGMRPVFNRPVIAQMNDPSHTTSLESSFVCGSPQPPSTNVASQLLVQRVEPSDSFITSLSSWTDSNALRAALSRSGPGDISVPWPAVESPYDLTPQTAESTDHGRLRAGQYTHREDAGLTHLEPATDEKKRAIIREWQSEMKLDRFLRRPCGICSVLTPNHEIRTVQSNKVDLTLLRNDDLPAQAKPTTYNFEAYSRAILDPYGLEDISTPRGIFMCKTCLNDLSHGLMPRFALANWLYYGRDQLPVAVREAFANMSVFEKALICRVRTNTIFCRFRAFDDETETEMFSSRRRHIKGNIVSTPLDVVHVNELLPPSTQEIADTLCALLISSIPPTRDTIDHLHPILVRKSRIKLLIDFLLVNNPHYQKSESFKGFSSNHLENLFTGPGDLGVPAAVRVGHLPVNDAIESASDDYSGRMDEVDGLIMENVSYTLGDRTAFSYREMKLHALQQCKEGRPFLSSRAGQQPVPDINNPNWLSWAHPNADPFGIGGFHHPRRRRPIGMEQQLRHLLTVRDPFFENDPELAFDTYTIIRKGTVNTSLRFGIPYTAYSRIVQDISRMDKSKLSQLRQDYRRDPNYQPQTDDERSIIRTMTSISPVARRIPGSVAQKIKMRNEIRAIICQRGSPSLFVTLNPADYYNPIVTVLANRGTSQSDLSILEDWNLKKRTQTALKHPMACAQFFDFMIKAFVRVILRYKRSDGKGGIFGRCDSYYGTVETQGRGSLHCHMLIWLSGHLPPETLASTLRSSEEYRTRLIEWLDSIVDSGFQGLRSCYNNHPSLERDDLNMSERHPATLPGPSVQNLTPDEFSKEMKEYLDELLLRFNWHVHTGTCWKYLRPRDLRKPENCRFGLDGTTSVRTSIDDETGAISLRRLHPRMTQYNPLTTFLMKCNTDVKFVGSGEEAKAFLYYVTDYITKAPLSMHAGLTALSYAIKQGESRGVLGDHYKGETDTRRAMTIAVNSMLSHQEISHPQVMSFIMGNGENYTPEKFQPLNWGEVLRYFERVCQIPESSTDAEAMNGISLSITVEAGHIKASNQLLDYIYRPDTEPFQDMNMYGFFSCTKTVPKLDRRGDSASFHREHPQYHTHTPKIRQTPVIPVLLGPRIPRRQGTEAEKERWARDISILFRPWRIPSRLVPPNGLWHEHLEHFLATFSPSDRQIIENMALLADAKQARDDRPRKSKHAPSHDGIVPSIEGLVDAAMQEEIPETESSIFSILQGSLDQPRQASDTNLLPGRLSILIGDEATNAFEQYLNIHDQLTHDEQSTSDPVEVTQDSQREDVQRQSTFMLECKLRRGNDQDKNCAIEEVTNAYAPPTTTETRPLSVEIETLRNRYRRTERMREDMWMAAYQLMQERGLLDNPEQRRAFEIIAHHVIEGGKQLLMYVGGRGGSGKTYLIETLVALFQVLDRSQEIRLAAPTGIAATLIGGNTLHSILVIGPNSLKSSEYNATSRRLAEEWRQVKYLVIDETSMVGASFLAQISSRLKMAKGDVLEQSNRIFGGLSVIFTGDFYQLAPPKQPSLFAHRLVRDPTFLQTRNNEGLDSIAGAYLWRRIDTVVLLQQNKRQANDALFAEILDRIRTNRCLDRNGKPILFAGFSAIDHLRRRQIAQVASRDSSVLSLFEDAPVIVGSKALRDILNASLLMAHARRIGRKVNIYHSSDFIHRQKAAESIVDHLWNLTSRVTGESFGRLPLFVGMRVMVTENISVPFNVVNGSEGIITGIKYSMDAKGRKFADAVYVDIPRCHIRAPGLAKGIVPLFPTSVSIKHDTRLGDNIAKTFRRRQIPIVPAYSYTDYKSQGRTLERAIVDISSARGQGIYVMLSRVTTLEGLLILRWFPESKILQRMSGELREELDRLQALAEKTEALYSAGVLAPSPLRAPQKAPSSGTYDVSECAIPEETMITSENLKEILEVDDEP